MTRNTNTGEHAHDTRDALEQRVHDAFESIGPDEAATERMLNKVLASQATPAPAEDAARTASARAGAPVAPPAASKHTFEANGQQPTPRKRIAAWKIALPAAACLALVAGVGFLAAQTLDQNASNATVEATAPAGKQTTGEMDSYGYAPEAAANAADGFAAGESLSYSLPGEPLASFNTEEYTAIDEPGFVSTYTRPLSTLAADADTASYANLRRLINQGYGVDDVYDEWAYLDADDASAEEGEVAIDPYYAQSGAIPKGAIRIEEMLNYFRYDYDQPQGDDLFGTTVRVGDCPWNPDTKLLVMGFATAPEQRSNEAGRNLVFLIDVSGSMDQPNKLPLLQDAFAELTDQLTDADRISIVTYSGAEEVVLDGASGSDARQIQRAIDRLHADGSTNGEAGLKMAYELAEKHFIEGGVNRIIMASDGDLNVGMSSESALEDFVDQKRASGIYLSVLGFGDGNYKDNKMETIADHGNGNYHYIDCQEEAERVFGRNLSANLVPLANDVKLQVEFNPAHVKGYRLIGYENRSLADEDFRDDGKDAGEIGPDHQFTVAYEVVLADSALDVAHPDLKYGEGATGNPDSSDWLTCTMRYQPADGSGAREQSFAVDESNTAADPGDDWRFAASVIEFGMVMRDSQHKGTATFDTIDDLLRSIDLSDADRKDFQRLVRKAS